VRIVIVNTPASAAATRRLDTALTMIGQRPAVPGRARNPDAGDQQRRCVILFFTSLEAFRETFEAAFWSAPHWGERRRSLVVGVAAFSSPNR
jgi:hypothetical protein